MTDYFEHIDAYVNGQFKGEEKERFEEEMQKNEALKKAVDNHRIASDALELLLEEDIRNVIKGSRTMKGKVLPLYKRRSVIAVAASFTILFVVYFGFRAYLESLYGHDAVIAKYYVPPMNPYNVRGDTAQTDLERAIFLFDAERYEESEEDFLTILNTSSDSEIKSRSSFYLGIISLIQKKYDTSLNYLLTSQDQRSYDYILLIGVTTGNSEIIDSLSSSDKLSGTKFKSFQLNTPLYKVYKFIRRP